MEVSQLRALRELGERGSIAAVAAAMRVTPSSVSQQISALQRRSSVPLTYKLGRRTALTDAGRALAAAAIDVEVALQRAEQAVASFQGEPSGIVSVAAFHSAGLAVFGPLVESLAAPSDPRLRLSDFDVAQDAFAGLTSAHDLVLAHRLVGSPPWSRSVRVVPLVLEPLDIVVRRDHRLAGKATIDPADLHDEEWVAVHEGFPLTQALAVISGVGGAETRVRHRINELRLAASVVSASGCVALMPRYTSDLDAHPELVLKPLADPGIGRYIDCLARPETLERAGVQAVLSRIRAITTGLTAR
jgi:DNA-binding transcriptional LysR family regulator